MIAEQLQRVVELAEKATPVECCVQCGVPKFHCIGRPAMHCQNPRCSNHGEETSAASFTLVGLQRSQHAALARAWLLVLPALEAMHDKWNVVSEGETLRLMVMVDTAFEAAKAELGKLGV